VFLVRLVSAQNLPTKDDDLLPAVYVKTQLIPSRKRVYISKVHRETANPVFNEDYEFDIEYQELQQQTLVFQILDHDCLSRCKAIGEVSVHLAELGTHGFNILREISLCVYISRPRIEWGLRHLRLVQSKYSARSAYYLGMTFISRERIALLESKLHFQIEYCNVPTVALFQIRNADWHQANVHVQGADCWRPDVSDLICVRSTNINRKYTFTREESVCCYKTVKNNFLKTSML